MLLRTLTGLVIVGILILADFLYSGWPLAVLMGIVFAIGWFELWDVSEVTVGPIREKSWALLTLVLLMTLAITNLRREFGPIYTLFFFATLWASDVAAYLVGRRFQDGHHFSAVSPAKTVVGLVAGFGAAVFVANIAQIFLPRPDALTICLVAGTLAPVGDLLFSTYKRDCDVPGCLPVKDFGTVLPGHGGILDRFDSMTLASVGVYLILRLLH